MIKIHLLNEVLGLIVLLVTEKTSACKSAGCQMEKHKWHHAKNLLLLMSHVEQAEKHPLYEFLYFLKDQRTIKAEICGFRPSAERMKMINCGTWQVNSVCLWQRFHNRLVNNVTE